MKIHLNQTEIEKAIIEKYVNPNVDWHEMTGDDELKLTIDLKATRGVEGFTCDVIIGEDHSDKPLGLKDAVETARAEPKAETVEPKAQAEEPAQQPVQSEAKAEGTEQAPEAPKRRGRPPGSRNKATIEAEAAAASNDTGEGAAPEEVAETVQEDKPEPTPFVKSGGLFGNRKTEEAPQPEPETQSAQTNDEPETEAEPEPSEEDRLAAEAARTEPQEPEAPAEEETPKPVRSLFGNLNRNNN